MSDVASLELSKELWELSGWESDLTWAMTERENTLLVSSNDKNLGHDIYRYSYSYDAGYLLRKLPRTVKHPATGEERTLGVSWHLTKKRWVADYERSMIPHAYATTPENALALLCIELHKEGILPISGRD